MVTATDSGAPQQTATTTLSITVSPSSLQVVPPDRCRVDK